MNKNWDEYFFNLCEVVSTNSKCLSRQIGAIIVKDKTVLSMGYNGPPRGVSHCGERYVKDMNLYNKLYSNLKTHEMMYNNEIKKMCPRKVLEFKSGEGLEFCIAGHAERNCIINAAREGISVKDSILYCSCPIPCTPCLIEIINAGIKEIVVTKLEYYDIMGEYLIKESGIKVRTFESDIEIKGY
jgi:dCMP deaminase